MYISRHSDITVCASEHVKESVHSMLKSVLPTGSVWENNILQIISSGHG